MVIKNGYQTTIQDLIELKNMHSINSRIEWIRKKASSVNGGSINVSKVASDIGVSPSVITKLESGFTKNPNLELIQNLSNYFSVPIAALFDEYYENPIPFTIFGPREIQLNIDPLLRPAYQIKLLWSITSLNTDYSETNEAEVYLSSTEIEEFRDEIEFLINKINKRQRKLSSSFQELARLQNKMEE